LLKIHPKKQAAPATHPPKNPAAISEALDYDTALKNQSKIFRQHQKSPQHHPHNTTTTQ
jgi:hypothetical protein